jgi:hypothetical protein
LAFSFRSRGMTSGTSTAFGVGLVGVGVPSSRRARCGAWTLERLLGPFGGNSVGMPVVNESSAVATAVTEQEIHAGYGADGAKRLLPVETG